MDDIGIRLMSESGAAQPGWYPQGDGRERWWDGQRWTDDTRSTAVPTRVIAGITFGTGSAGGSLAAGIMCLVLLPGMLVMLVASLMDGVAGLTVVAAVATFALAVFAWLAFTNWRVVRQAQRSSAPEPPRA